MLRAMPAVALMIICLAFSASAQEAPPGAELIEKSTPAFTCSAQSEGQLTCQANKQCTCGHKPADAASGLPARWAWDCGIMRPRCEVTPADTSGDAYTLPPLIIERGEEEDGGGE